MCGALSRVRFDRRVGVDETLRFADLRRRVPERPSSNTPQSCSTVADSHVSVSCIARLVFHAQGRMPVGIHQSEQPELNHETRRKRRRRGGFGDLPEQVASRDRRVDLTLELGIGLEVQRDRR